jgi:hypothetical protein
MENNELHIRIIRCLEIIERMNKAIDFHASLDEADRDSTAIEQYTEIKGRIVNELQELLNQLFVMDKIPFKIAM